MIVKYYNHAMDKRQSICLSPKPCFFPECRTCIHLNPILGDKIKRIKVLVRMSMDAIDNVGLSEISMGILQERAYHFIVPDPSRNFVGANAALYAEHKDSIKSIIYDVLFLERLTNILETQKVSIIVRMEMESWIRQTLTTSEMQSRLYHHFQDPRYLGVDLYGKYIEGMIRPILHVFKMVKEELETCDLSIITTRRHIKPLLIMRFSEEGQNGFDIYQRHKKIIYSFISNFIDSDVAHYESIPCSVQRHQKRHYA